MKPAQEGFSGPFPKERIGCPLSRFTLFAQGRQTEKGKRGEGGEAEEDWIKSGVNASILLVLDLLQLRRWENYV